MRQRYIAFADFANTPIHQTSHTSLLRTIYEAGTCEVQSFFHWIKIPNVHTHKVHTNSYKRQQKVHTRSAVWGGKWPLVHRIWITYLANLRWDTEIQSLSLFGVLSPLQLIPNIYCAWIDKGEGGSIGKGEWYILFWGGNYPGNEFLYQEVSSLECPLPDVIWSVCWWTWESCNNNAGIHACHVVLSIWSLVNKVAVAQLDDW